MNSDLLSQQFVLFACLALLFESLLDLSQLVMQLGSLIADILPLEVHEEAQTLRVELVALIEHDLFKYDCKTFLLHFSSLLVILAIIFTQYSADRFETLFRLAQLLVLGLCR